MRYPIKIFYYLVTTVLLIVAIGFYFSGNLISQIAKSQLRIANFQDVEILTLRPGFFSLKVPTLKLVLKLPTKDVSLKFQEVTLHYSLSSLLRKKLTGITIEAGSIDIKLIDQQTKSNSTKSSTSSNFLINPDIFPLNYASINNLLVSLETPNLKKYLYQANLAINKEDRTLTGNLNLDSKDPLDLLEQLVLDFSLTEKNFNSKIHLISHSTTSIPFLPDSNWNLEANYQNNLLALSGMGILQFPQIVKTELIGNYNLLEQSGQLGLKTDPSSALEARLAINQILKEIKVPINFSSGDVQTNLDFTLRQHELVQLNLDLSANNLAGVAGKSIFSGLNGQHQLSLLSGVKSVTPEKVTLEKISFGPEVSNLKGELSFSQNKDRLNINLENLSGNIFDGDITSKQISFIPSAKKNNLVLQINQINIEKVLQIYPQKNIQATGVLDGIIPLVFTSEGPLIEKSNLTARAPGGFIKYNSNETLGASTNNDLQFASKVLRNFHYNHLSADLDLNPDGKLQIELKINGRNPDLNFKQDVNVNLNIEENLPALLRSIQAISGIDSKIRKMLEK